MAEQGFTVKISARTDQYMSAIASATKATKDLGDSGVNLERLGGKMQDVGTTLSKAVTLPVIAVGGAAVKMATDFDSAFGRMVGLAGVESSEVDGLKESVLGLAGQTAQAPQALADGLYFLRSSGLDAASAMDALAISAKASAAGLGPTEVIADAVSSAMNAYAKSGLSAAEATDTLVATARAGKAEPAELAGALGRVLPIASELGITFQDVGGAIASLSLSGNDASQSATLLTNIMSKLLKPSQQAQDALAGVGLSTDTIRASIADKGLLATLEELRTKLGDAGFVKFLEDAQAVQGALALTGENAAHVSDVFADVKASTGATDEAFKAMSETAGFKMKQAWADVQVAMIQAGDVILPIVSNIAGGISKLAELFTGLPGPVKTIVIGLIGLAAAAGPVVMIGGSMVKNFDLVTKSLSSMGTAMTGTSLALGGLGLVMIAATGWYLDNASKKAHLVAVTNDFVTALKEEEAGQKGAVDAAIAKALSDQTLIENAHKLGLNSKDLAMIVKGEVVPRFQELQKVADDNGFSMSSLAVNAKTLGMSSSDLAENNNDLQHSFYVVSQTLAPFNDGLDLANKNLAFEKEAARDAFASVGDVDSIHHQLIGTVKEVTGATKDLNTVLPLTKEQQDALAVSAKAYSDALQTQIDKLDALYPKEYDAVKAKYSYRDAQAAALVAIDAFNKSLADGKATQEDHNAASRAATDAMIAQAEKYATLDGAAIGSEGAIRRQIQSLKDQEAQLAPDSPLRAFLDGYITDLANIPSNISTIMDLHISAGSITTAAGDIIGARGGARASGGRVSAGEAYVVGEHGPEPFIPDTNGTILPHGDLLGMMSYGEAAQRMGDHGSAERTSSQVVQNQSVNFLGGINNTVDLDAAFRRANFALAGLK